MFVKVTHAKERLLRHFGFFPVKENIQSIELVENPRLYRRLSDPKTIEKITLSCITLESSMAGSSQIAGRLAGGEFNPRLESTYGMDIVGFNISNNYQVSLFDISSATRYAEYYKASYRSKDCLLLVIDVTDPDALDVVQNKIAAVGGIGNTQEVIVVANKIDALQSRVISSASIRKFAQSINAAACIECSAKSGVGIAQIKETLQMIAVLKHGFGIRASQLSRMTFWTREQCIQIAQAKQPLALAQSLGELRNWILFNSDMFSTIMSHTKPAELALALVGLRRKGSLNMESYELLQKDSNPLAIGESMHLIDCTALLNIAHGCCC